MARWPRRYRYVRGDMVLLVQEYSDGTVTAGVPNGPGRVLLSGLPALPSRLEGKVRAMTLREIMGNQP